jgi:PKD repeat protein
MQIQHTILGLLLLIGISACAPTRDDEFQLTETPNAPSFTIQTLSTDPNQIIIKDLTSGGFQRVWDLPGANPNTSTLELDTIQYAKAGAYLITLHVSKSDGSGSSSVSQTVNIAADAPLICSPKLALLTGDCTPLGKCWTLSRAPGAVKVGPTYDDFSWFTSVADGLQASQYDDGFCFTFENLVFENKNNGASVNPWNGYQAEAYQPGMSTFKYLEGSGTLGRDQILLDDSQFMGVWDCDNLLDILSLSESQLTVRGRQREQNGTPKTEGWFQLTFVPI